MKFIRTRVIVALASSAVLASGLAVTAVAASSVGASAAVVATSTTGVGVSSYATVIDP
jgi:hypothetical protein